MIAETPKLARRGTVLVVDDEEGVRASVRVILEETCDVLEAENGAAALDLLRVHEVDLVMLDQRMPGEPGIEVLFRSVWGRRDSLLLMTPQGRRT